MTKKIAIVALILLLSITVLVLIFLLIDSNTRLNSLQNQLSNLETEYSELKDIRVKDLLANSKNENKNNETEDTTNPVFGSRYTALEIEECGITIPYPTEAGWRQDKDPMNYSVMYNATYSIKISKEMPNTGSEGAHYLTIKCWKDSTTTLESFRSRLDAEIAMQNENNGVCQWSIIDEQPAELSRNTAIKLTQDGCMLPTQTYLTRNDEYLYQFDYIVPNTIPNTDQIKFIFAFMDF